MHYGWSTFGCRDEDTSGLWGWLVQSDVQVVDVLKANGIIVNTGRCLKWTQTNSVMPYRAFRKTIWCVWCMRTIKGISEAFNHAVEWQSKGWSEKRGLFPFSPSLRATDYKCPKYVWYVVETDWREGNNPCEDGRRAFETAFVRWGWCNLQQG